MGEKGWGVPTWPKQYGGGGLSPAEARVLNDELAKAGEEMLPFYRYLIIWKEHILIYEITHS